MQEKSEPKKEIHWVFTQLRMGGLPRSLKLGVFLGTRSNRLRFLSIFKEILQGGPQSGRYGLRRNPLLSNVDGYCFPARATVVVFWLTAERRSKSLGGATRKMRRPKARLSLIGVFVAGRKARCFRSRRHSAEWCWQYR